MHKLYTGFGFVVAALAATPAQADDAEKVAVLSYLGLDAASGKTEVGEKGGELESWIAAGALAKTAACEIAREINGGAAVQPPAPCSSLVLAEPVLVLGDGEAFNFGPYVLVSARLKRLQKTFELLGSCSTQGLVAQSAPDPSNLPAAIISALKTDTKITGTEVKLEERALVNAVAGVLGPQAILRDGLVAAGDKLDADWAELANQASRVGTGCKGDDGKAAVAFFDASEKVLFGGDGPSLFDQARALQPIANGRLPQHILRLRVEHVGGTLINAQNILTTLGAPAVSLSAGMVISYRFTDTATGGATRAGIVVCRAGVRKLHSFNNPAQTLPPGTCVPSETKE